MYDLKLADFGKAISFGPTEKFQGLCGTVGYMAPEQLGKDGLYDNRADVWALGVVFFNLIAGEMPFRGDSMPETNQSVLSAPVSFKAPGWERCAPSVTNLVGGMLKKDPN